MHAHTSHPYMRYGCLGACTHDIYSAYSCVASTSTNLVRYKHSCQPTHPCLNRDGPDNVHFLGIDVSMEALHLAKGNLVKQCPQLSTKNIEMVCAEYLEGLKQARARCSSTLAHNPTFSAHVTLGKHSACVLRSEYVSQNTVRIRKSYSASCMF